MVDAIARYVSALLCQMIDDWTSGLCWGVGDTIDPETKARYDLFLMNLTVQHAEFCVISLLGRSILIWFTSNVAQSILYKAK